eukprot:6092112-Prymnesium_polylepis.2
MLESLTDVTGVTPSPSKTHSLAGVELPAKRKLDPKMVRVLSHPGAVANGVIEPYATTANCTAGKK